MVQVFPGWSAMADPFYNPVSDTLLGTVSFSEGSFPRVLVPYLLTQLLVKIAIITALILVETSSA